jgi:hypothetical protein
MPVETCNGQAKESNFSYCVPSRLNNLYFVPGARMHLELRGGAAKMGLESILLALGNLAI